MSIPDSSNKEIVWPAIAPPEIAAKLAVQFQLKQSQWWSQQDLKEQQLEQISLILTHAYKTVPFYKKFYQSHSFRPKKLLTEKLFSKIPILSREQVQNAREDFISTNIPDNQGKLYDVSTSGSTGKSIKLKTTDISRFFWNAFTFRDHLWHNRDVSKKLCIIKATSDPRAIPPLGAPGKSWGSSTEGIKKSGNTAMLSIASTIDEQWEWLKQQAPEYLLVYPSTLRELVKLSRKENLKPKKLIGISTLGELLSQDIRDDVSQYWGITIHDMYSCQEAGYLALQCPDYPHYHVQSENVILEVLNENNEPCAKGEVGRVVISSLHNYASPLIRYDIGDFAEVGEDCPCGRGLPVIKRLAGRIRNLLTYPDGTKSWPMVGSNDYHTICNVQQFQFIQKSVEEIDIKLVVEGELSDTQEKDLKALMIKSLRYDFKLNFILLDNIERSKGGKFEDFISLVK